MIHGFPRCTVVSRSLIPFPTGSQCTSLCQCLPPDASQLSQGPLSHCYVWTWLVFMLPFLLQAEQKPKPLLGRGHGGRRYSLDWVSPNQPGGMGRVTLAWQGHRKKTGTKTETESVGPADKAGPAWLRGTRWGLGQSGDLSRLPPGSLGGSGD